MHVERFIHVERFYVVSGLCRVILILVVITAELCEFINNLLKAMLCDMFD